MDDCFSTGMDLTKAGVLQTKEVIRNLEGSRVVGRGFYASYLSTISESQSLHPASNCGVFLKIDV